MRVLITGGAGMVGFNLAKFYHERGDEVIVIDNLERSSLLGHKEISERRLLYNYDELKKMKVEIHDHDIYDRKTWCSLYQSPDVIFHMAAQCGVPTSINNPRRDFEINTVGTLNMLEYARNHGSRVVYASTNKVYPIHNEWYKSEIDNRWHWISPMIDGRGWPVTAMDNVGSRTPYGTSKFSGDLLCQEYSHTFGVPTGVFRMSCISPKSRVKTIGGWKYIEKIQRGDIVHTGQNWTRVKRCWRNGFRATKTIKTRGGNKLTATGDHKILCPSGFRKVEELMYGDLIASYPVGDYRAYDSCLDFPVSKESYLKTVELATKDKRTLARAEKIADRVFTPDGSYALTRLIGYLFGDGTLGLYHKANRDQNYCISFYGSLSALENVKKDLELLGISSPKITEHYSKSRLAYGHVIEGKSKSIRIVNKAFGILLTLLEVPVGDRTVNITSVPKWIKEAVSVKAREQKAFLSGFLGAEATVPPDNNNCISFSQSKEVSIFHDDQFVDELIYILNAQGIPCSRTNNKPVEHSTRTTIQSTVRLVGGKETSLKLAEIGIAYEDVREEFLAERISKIYGHDYLGGKIIWDKIVAVEDSLSEMVWDLEVEDAQHTFNAEGIIISNCIYGENQFGFEEQGWATWFAIATLKGLDINIYGDGCQVRDMLFVEDLVRAYNIYAQSNIHHKVWNIGGGPKFTLSLNECLDHLEDITGKRSKVHYHDWRPSDQRIYTSDIRNLYEDLAWEPTIKPREGLERIVKWVEPILEVF